LSHFIPAVFERTHYGQLQLKNRGLRWPHPVTPLPMQPRLRQLGAIITIVGQQNALAAKFFVPLRPSAHSRFIALAVRLAGGAWEALMPLPDELRDVVLSHPCPHCGHKVEKKGSWFMSQRRHYQCASCHKPVPMGYSDKFKLFERYAPRRGR
jgi:endogenous inhibitor of DNA gyrase (YacG/DUF329 family)